MIEEDAGSQDFNVKQWNRGSHKTIEMHENLSNEIVLSIEISKTMLSVPNQVVTSSHILASPFDFIT